MNRNMSTTDKIIRVIIAAVIAVLYFTGYISGIVGIILLVVGGVLLLTSFVNFCPLYAAFGLSTRKVKEKK